MANVIGTAANTGVDIAVGGVDAAIAGLKAVADAAEAEAHEAVSVGGKAKDIVLAEIETQKGILENLMRGLANAVGNLGQG
jgi:hypothetical protein